MGKPQTTTTTPRTRPTLSALGCTLDLAETDYPATELVELYHADRESAGYSGSQLVPWSWLKPNEVRLSIGPGGHGPGVMLAGPIDLVEEIVVGAARLLAARRAELATAAGTPDAGEAR